MCVLICILKLCACTQGRHWLHLCAFSPVCVILCFCNLCMFLCASVITLVKLTYKAPHQCAPSCEFAMHHRKWKSNSAVCSCAAFLVHVSSSCAFLIYLITLMLRYTRIAHNGVDFPQCVSKCAFSD